MLTDREEVALRLMENRTTLMNGDVPFTRLDQWLGAADAFLTEARGEGHSKPPEAHSSPPSPRWLKADEVDAPGWYWNHEGSACAVWVEFGAEETIEMRPGSIERHTLVGHYLGPLTPPEPPA